MFRGGHCGQSAAKELSNRLFGDRRETPIAVSTSLAAVFICGSLPLSRLVAMLLVTMTFICIWIAARVRSIVSVGPWLVSIARHGTLRSAGGVLNAYARTGFGS